DVVDVLVGGKRVFSFFFQAEDGIRDGHVTGVQTCALPISLPPGDYCFIDDSKKDALRVPDFTKENQNLAPSQQYHLTSEECLKQWWETCDKTLKVEKKDLKGVVIKYHRACNPPCVVGGPKPM